MKAATQSPPRITSWDDLYKSTNVEAMPWFSPHLDHDLVRALDELKITGGHFIDIGAGPGTHAIEMAKRGFKVTATDISETAVEKARVRASREKFVIDFRQDDIVNTRLRKKFDLALDLGCFHSLAIDKRAAYVKNISRLLKKGGYLFLKTFSYKEPGNAGPKRFRPEEIEKLFEKQFEIVSIRDSVFNVARKPNPKALFCILHRY